MLQIYDKALAVSALALAALASPALAETTQDGPTQHCDLSNGYGDGMLAFAREADACLAAPMDAGLEDIAQDVRTLTDRAREKSGATALDRRVSLDDAARAHALDLAVQGYAAHADQTGRTNQDRVRTLDRTGIYGAMGANVIVVDASVNAVDIYNDLLADTVSAANMDRADFTHGGIGMAEANGQRYVVQLFGQVDGELAEPLPLGLPTSAAIDVRFADPTFALAAWHLDDADGLRVRRGTVNRLKRVGTERGDLTLVLEAERDGQVHTLKGPALSADPQAPGF
ncbi:MAG: CAP domain-containing protein [Pseudomonadota bacterium]